MNKWLLLLLPTMSLIFLGVFTDRVVAADGQAIFESMRCGSCHKPDVAQAGISLKQIALGYGDSAKLTAYLEGKSEAIIEPQRQDIMRAQLKKIAGLSNEEKQALADYLLSFK